MIIKMDGQYQNDKITKRILGIFHEHIIPIVFLAKKEKTRIELTSINKKELFLEVHCWESKKSESIQVWELSIERALFLWITRHHSSSWGTLRWYFNCSGEPQVDCRQVNFSSDKLDFLVDLSRDWGVSALDVVANFIEPDKKQEIELK